MQMSAKDDWMSDEPTVAEEEREAIARKQMVASVVDQVRATMPDAGVLVVARSAGVPTGVLVPAQHTHLVELDGVVLAELLASASDDRLALSLVRLVLGDVLHVEHTVARDRDGKVMGVIAIAPVGRISAVWMRTVLARSAAGLAAWLAHEPTWPPQTLLEAIDEPALAHESNIVLAANSALARALGREVGEIIGLPVSRIARQLTLVRSCWLVVGGRTRRAMIFEGRPTIATSVLASLDRVLAARYAFARQVTRISIENRDSTAVLAPPSAIDELLSLALLDMTAAFASVSTSNYLRVAVTRDNASVVVELVATGALTHAAAQEHLGAVICASRTRSLGGQFFTDATCQDRRLVRISLPVAS